MDCIKNKIAGRRYFRRLGADGEVIFDNDARVRILSCLKQNQELKEEEENLDELLKARSVELGKPIQMSGALTANWSGQREIIRDQCLVVRSGSRFYVVRVPHVTLFTDFGFQL